MAMQEQFCETCGAANSVTARFCQYCAAPLPFQHTTGDLPEQTLLDSRYQLEARIGQGGMGAVYKAVDTRFNNRPIAIKEIVEQVSRQRLYKPRQHLSVSHICLRIYYIQICHVSTITSRKRSDLIWSWILSKARQSKNI